MTTAHKHRQETTSRSADLNEWLKLQINTDTIKPELLFSDASARKYYRVRNDKQSFVVMDAPPERENCHSFIEVARGLRQHGFCVPEVFAADMERGFLLLTDFGDQLLLQSLTPTTAEHFYQQAMASLVQLSQLTALNGCPLPRFDVDFMMMEMQRFLDWFLTQHLSCSLDSEQQQRWQNSFQYIADEVAKQPYVVMHRDYHSRNLMLLGDGKPLGIIDFQDAMIGPLCYDLVSLLRDCYIVWPEQNVWHWVDYFFERLSESGVINVDNATFRYWFDMTSIQRHLKVIGIFARLHHRDGKSHFLNDIPAALNYLLAVSQRYESLAFVHQQLQQAQLAFQETC